ncbi:iron-sulfur cluster assembly scaffold protein [Patescibacteria group bacterium]|nr:iron-sulfur cluster assembly scaffold protein [Patescibacteria group bacterium]MBU1016302.1 iron-sulfur cluster assembly scaffold protein [Patescibacteria group bacterium]MBU1685578.1 iron-sulfur cluster assembly scaffold protein [Patescibacteria group bacterium]MBU1938503.1 iron-sulfur cluster assembly scaffold protein [Patescibacteria group bacterium]
MDIYAQNILDRYKKPFYKDKKLDASIRHKEANHSCGDVVEVDLQMQGDKVTAYSFSGNGCAISMASADMLGDLATGLTKKEILKLTKEEIYKMLGIEISVRRSKCALLSLLALQNALIDESRH